MSDFFVKGILDDSSPREAVEINRSETMLMQNDTDGHSATPRTPLRYDTIGDERVAKPAQDVATMKKASQMFRYSLIFINFTFIVASLLLIMAGIVARENSAVKLCTHCGELTLVPIIFGVILWLFAMFGFNWIRQRNILFLLVYVGFLGILSLALFSVLVSAGVFDADVKENRNTGNFLSEWEAQVRLNDTSSGSSPLCRLQALFNCSGFEYGCCAPYDAATGTGCYGINGTSTPAWVEKVCPICPDQAPADQICTDLVYATLRRNLGGFLVISCFSMLLIVNGILLAALSRKVNQSLDGG